MSLAFVHAHDCIEPHSDAVWGAAWTTTDNVVSVSADGSVKQWASSSGQRQPPNAAFPAPHTLGLVSLSVAPDGRRALYNSIEGLTSLWDLTTGEVVGRFESYARTPEGAEPSWAVSLHPSGETYAATSGAGNVVVYSAQPENFGQRVSSLSTGRSKFGMYCQHSPDGKRIALSTETGQIYIFDVEAGELTTTYTSHAMSVRSLAWSADSSLLLSASEDKRLVLHDVRTSAGGTVASFTGHASWVLSVDISQDGRLGLSGSADKSIKIWDIGARAAVSTVQDTGEVWAVSWRPRPAASGPGAFVSGGEDGTVRWWRGAGVGIGEGAV
ncbi:WD repeat-containing protein 61 [Mycena belliarum]|uniref:WD repeat-containing protein 61 n=1 Tax=Mycena belliarum TaxID=1033014 RepID=A0AAD6XX15_9AGAR|nr:WD repeat-containing protein 61 [Mycena belliae]